MNNTVIVIPTYNEVENIGRLVASIRSLVTANIIVVDDNSPDGTGALLDNLAQKDPALHVIHRAKKLGLAAAYIAGLNVALLSECDPIIQMDCDFSHNPKHLLEMITVSETSDLVIGSKYTAGGAVVGLNWWRAALSRYGNNYLSWTLSYRRHVKIHDFTSGYLCWRRSLLSKIDFTTITSDGYAFLIELKWQALQRTKLVTEIPIVFHDRVAGKSKLTPHIIREALRLPFHIRRKTTGDTNTKRGSLV